MGNCRRSASPKVLIVRFSILGNVAPSEGFLFFMRSCHELKYRHAHRASAAGTPNTSRKIGNSAEIG
jgi:hypothetical protein